MKTKQATVIIDKQEWIVLDTDQEKDGKVFCTLMSQDGAVAWHMWVKKEDIKGVI